MMSREQYHKQLRDAKNIQKSHVPSKLKINNYSNTVYKPHHYGRNTIIGIIAIIVIAFYTLNIMNGISHFNQTSYDMTNPSISAETRINKHQPISVLMMGTDTGAIGRHEKRGRTDTMMINTINPQKQNMLLMSIPRDAPANYDGILTKINSVYTLGGATQAQKYVQDWLNVPINYYMIVNMGGLRNIINRVGGVTITPTRTFKYGAVNVKKGHTIKMNGIQALDYCRMRHQDPLGDYGRQIRQRQVLFQLFTKISKVHNLLLHPRLINALSNNMKTNLSTHDLMKLMLFYRHADRHHISDHLQGHTAQINGQDFEQIPDAEKQQKTRKINSDMNNWEESY